MIHVKGAAVISRLRYVRERIGEPALVRLKQALSEEQRAWLEMRLLATQWLPYDLFIDLLTKADAMFGEGDLALCREMGRFSAEANLRTFYRIFFRMGSTRFMIRRVARLWQVHYDSGSLELVEDGPGKVRLFIRDFAVPHRAHCLSVLGWCERSVELTGAHLKRAEELQCRAWGAPECELAFEWK